MRRFTPALLLAGLLANACASILGIEEIKPDTDGGSTSAAGPASGSSGGSGVAGSDPTGAMGGGAVGAAATTTSGAAGAGGAGGGSGGTSSGGAGAGGGVTGSGGAAGQAGSSGGAGGTRDAGVDANPRIDAGDAGPTTITVGGKVIDIRRRPFPNLPVMIGSTLATTDAAGRFSIPNVTPPYDISLVITGSSLTEGWAFIGNTRPDPTLQLDWEAPPHLTANEVTVTFTGIGANDQAAMSWGSPDGWFTDDQLTNPGLTLLSASWSGPMQSAGMIHALRWTPFSGSPTTYLAYDEKPFTLTANANSQIALDLTTENPAIAAGTISGSVTSGEIASPSVVAYAAFPSGGAIPIPSGSASSTFSYRVPRIANATVSLVASAGTFNYPSGLVLKRGLPTTDQTGVVLAIPNPPHQMFPSNGGTASTQTDFTWTGQDAVYILNFAYGVEVARDPAIVYRVITAQKGGRLPRLPTGSGIDPMPGHQVEWWVEIQGPFASMTDATGPAGFIAPLDDFEDIAGPLDRDAIRVRSARWSANTVAP